MSNSDGGPLRVSALVGAVTRGPFGTGSKSERTALWLETPDRRLVLRRKGGPSFDDRTIEKYVGKRVKCDGFIIGYTLLAERIEVIS